MTSIELKKRLAAAADVEWHKEVEVSFNFSYVAIEVRLKGVSAIWEFVNQQVLGWGNMGEVLPDQFVESKQYFISIRDQIENFIANFSEKETGNLNHYWGSVSSAINNIRPKPLPYDIPEVDFLVKIYKEVPNYFSGAYNFIVDTGYNINSRELFFGAILAYEFTFKGQSELLGRRRSERASLTRVRNDFNSYLNESETTLIDHLKASNDKFTDYASEIDTLKQEKDAQFTEWFEYTKSTEWQTWYEEKLDRVKKLEDTYEAKLKLEKPARYWDTKSKKYYSQGEEAKKILITVVIVVSLFLAAILIISPDWIFNTVFSGNSVAIVRWSVVFITLLTLVAFTVKALTKYMFSSYHLARDAEERHTLTFFYLALLKDSQMNEDERKLILQSLFSRVETGLLKDDSAPTMPSDIVNRVIK